MTPRLSEAAAPVASMEPVELAWASKSPSAVTCASSCTTARVVLAMVFSAMVTATDREAALPLLLMLPPRAAATTSAVIVVASSAVRDTEPAFAVTSAEPMRARTELVVLLVALAPAPVSETVVPLPLPPDTPTPTATTVASMSLLDEASSVMSPVAAVTSTLSMTAAAVLVMVLSATAAVMLPLMEAPLPLPMVTLAATATASELIAPDSVAVRLTGPPACTTFTSPASLSSMAARTSLVTVLKVRATAAFTFTEVSLLPVVRPIPTPKAVALIEPEPVASADTAPSVMTLLSSKTAEVSLSTSLMASEKPSPTPTLLPLELTEMLMLMAPEIASMVLSSVAARLTSPPATTLEPETRASIVLSITLRVPEPAPASAVAPLLPPLATAPAMPSAKVSIAAVEDAVRLTPPPVSSVESMMAARVVACTSLVAAAAPAAIAARLPLPLSAAVTLAEPACELICEASLAVIVTAPLAVSALSSTTASMVASTVLPEPDPAPPKAELPLLAVAAPARVKASIFGAAVAVRITLSATMVEPSLTARTVSVISLMAMEAATAPVGPFVSTATAKPPASPRMLVWSPADRFTLPRGGRDRAAICQERFDRVVDRVHDYRSRPSEGTANRGRYTERVGIDIAVRAGRHLYVTGLRGDGCTFADRGPDGVRNNVGRDWQPQPMPHHLRSAPFRQQC